MSTLKEKFIKSDYKIINNIADNIQVIDINGMRCLLKRIQVPLCTQELNSQHCFVNHLLSNGIKTPKIIDSFLIDNQQYEIQEYIANSQPVNNPLEMLRTIADFHNISSKFDNFKKRNYYDYSFICRGIILDKLLLGFDEKYYIYPRKNIMDNYNIISKDNRLKLNEIITIYDYCYNYFINKYNTQDCVIHNDITPNNIIKNNTGIYLIDFDLSIKSSVYVDFVDCILKRYHNLEEILYDNELFQNIDKYINEYNNYSNNILKKDAVLCAIILKIISFNFYVLFNKQNACEFNKNFDTLYSLNKRLHRSLVDEL